VVVRRLPLITFFSSLYANTLSKHSQQLRTKGSWSENKENKMFKDREREQHRKWFSSTSRNGKLLCDNERCVAWKNKNKCRESRFKLFPPFHFLLFASHLRKWEIFKLHTANYNSHSHVHLFHVLFYCRLW
jgi:hypothetical protein